MKQRLLALGSNLASMNAPATLIIALAGVLSFLIGLQFIPEAMFPASPSARFGTWSLMVLACLAGAFAQSQASEKKQYETHTIITPAELPVAAMMAGGVYSAVPHKDGRWPGLVGLSLFLLTFWISDSLIPSWFDVERAIGPAFIVWGCYALIIQIPWSSMLHLQAERASSRRERFTRYVIVVKRHNSVEWVLLTEAYETMREAISKGAEIRKTCEVEHIRLIEEEGTRQIRMTSEHDIIR